MSQKKLALVTGANKGVGFGITQLLCQYLGKDWDILLTARNQELGNKAVEQLKEKEGLNCPKFHQLDITNEASRDVIASYIKDNYGGLDILVNNAGIAYKVNSTAPFGEQAEVTIATNFFGTLNVCRKLFPLLRPHARVVNVSSLVSRMVLGKMGPDIKSRFLNKMSMTELEANMQEFIDAAKAGTHTDKGWPNTAYGMSKVGVTMMTFIQQEDFDKDPREDVVINSCCVGFCDTDMTSHKGPRPPIEGADTPFYLATLPPNVTDPKGKHVEDRKVFPWE